MRKNNKTLAIVTGSLGSGGLEKVTSLIANWYVQNGWKVYIILLLDVGKKVFVQLDERIDVIFYENKKEPGKIKKLLIARKWISFLKEKFNTIQPTIVLAMTLKIAALCSRSIPNDVRLVMREISDPKAKVRNVAFDKMLFNIVSKKVDSIIFQTSWEQKCYPKSLREKGFVVPNPIMVKAKASTNKTKTIVTMGRLLNKQKRHDILLRAFSIFHKRHPDYTLKIYGEGPDKLKDERLIGKLNIRDCAQICTPINNIHEVIKDSKMFIMTSDFEGLSNALLEAMLVGIPCITSDWPGVEDAIKHKFNGLIYKRQNVNELAQLIEELLDTKLANELSLNAQKEYQKYKLETILPLYAKAIEGE